MHVIMQELEGDGSKEGAGKHRETLHAGESQMSEGVLIGEAAAHSPESERVLLETD